MDGNFWASAGWVGDGYDGVHVFAPSGDRIGLIKLPEICSNVCFGDSRCPGPASGPTPSRRDYAPEGKAKARLPARRAYSSQRGRAGHYFYP